MPNSTQLENKSHFPRKFNPRLFLLLHLVPAILGIIWYFCSQNAALRQIDQAIFLFLNQPLENHSIYRILITLSSHRAVDLVIAVVSVGILLKQNFVLSQSIMRPLLSGFIVSMFVLMIFRLMIDAVALSLAWNQPSPSLIVDNAVRITEYYPNWGVKDKSTESYPGDHFSVILFWFCWVSIGIQSIKRNWKGYAVCILVVIIVALPRLAAGAHWFSDLLFGSLLVTLPSFAWSYYTGLLNKPMHYFLKLVNFSCTYLSTKFPYLTRYAVFN